MTDMIAKGHLALHRERSNEARLLTVELALQKAQARESEYAMQAMARDLAFYHTCGYKMPN